MFLLNSVVHKSHRSGQSKVLVRFFIEDIVSQEQPFSSKWTRVKVINGLFQEVNICNLGMCCVFVWYKVHFSFISYLQKQTLTVQNLLRSNGMWGVWEFIKHHISKFFKDGYKLSSRSLYLTHFKNVGNI